MQTDSYVPPAGRPSLDVAVVMRREPVTGPMSRWQSARWVLADVLPQGEPFVAGPAEAGRAPAAPEEVVPVEAGTGTSAVRISTDKLRRGGGPS